MIEQFVRENVEAQTVRLDFFLKLLDRMFQEAVGLHESTVPLTLLFASVLKARQAGHAVQLIAQQGYVEEVLSISRTLVEVTVNAAYLQFAGDGELVRYLQFHPESVYQQVGMLRQKRGRMFNSGIMGKLSDLMQRGGSALAVKGTNQADPSWTARSLMDRAELSDRVSHIPVMSLLVKRCYPKGHSAVHGTIGSLDNFVTQLTSLEAVKPEPRLNQLSEALFAVNLSLMTLCIFLNSAFQLGMDGSIDEAASADSESRASLEGR